MFVRYLARFSTDLNSDASVGSLASSCMSCSGVKLQIIDVEQLERVSFVKFWTNSFIESTVCAISRLIIDGFQFWCQRWITRIVLHLMQCLKTLNHLTGTCFLWNIEHTDFYRKHCLCEISLDDRRISILMPALDRYHRLASHAMA